VDTSFLAGMARTGERLISLLNIEKLVPAEAVAPVAAV
jgi:hypothetical protein